MSVGLQHSTTGPPNWLIGLPESLLFGMVSGPARWCKHLDGPDHNRALWERRTMADSHNTATEEWRTIPGFAEFEISNLGRVRRSLHQRASEGRPGRPPSPGRILRQFPINGYPAVEFHDGGKRSVRHVHRLLAEAFIGPPPTPKHQAAHWDGDRSNLALSNLRWATPKENAEDKKRHGKEVIPRGENSGASKLSFDQVTAIRAEYTGRYGQRKQLAERYGVTTQTIYDILRGKSWSLERIDELVKRRPSTIPGSESS